MLDCSFCHQGWLNQFLGLGGKYLFRFFYLNKCNHDLKTVFRIYSGYLCGVLKFVRWSELSKCDKNAKKMEGGKYFFTGLSLQWAFRGSELLSKLPMSVVSINAQIAMSSVRSNLLTGAAAFLELAPFCFFSFFPCTCQCLIVSLLLQLAPSFLQPHDIVLFFPSDPTCLFLKLDASMGIAEIV